MKLSSCGAAWQAACRLATGMRGDFQSPRRMPSCPTEIAPFLSVTAPGPGRARERSSIGKSFQAGTTPQISDVVVCLTNVRAVLPKPNDSFAGFLPPDAILAVLLPDGVPHQLGNSRAGLAGDHVEQLPEVIVEIKLCSPHGVYCTSSAIPSWRPVTSSRRNALPRERPAHPATESSSRVPDPPAFPTRAMPRRSSCPA